MTKAVEPAETRRSLHTHTHTHTHTSKFLLSIFSVFIFYSGNAFCADDFIIDEIQYKEQLVRELKEEIQQIDSEMMRCERVKKGWVAATIVGGIGVAATGTAAIVQTVQAKKKTENKTEENK